MPNPTLTAKQAEDPKHQASAAPPPTDAILTTKQVSAEFPFLPEATLRWWRHSGDRGPASFVIGKKVLYRRSEVERWLAEQEAATTRGGAA